MQTFEIVAVGDRIDGVTICLGCPVDENGQVVSYLDPVPIDGYGDTPRLEEIVCAVRADYGDRWVFGIVDGDE